MKLFNTLLLLLLGLSTITSTMDQPLKLPLVYHSNYNIGLCGIERLHPFPTGKYGQIHTELKKAFNLDNSQFHSPTIATNELLATVHTKEYLESLNTQVGVAEALEFTVLLPAFVFHYAALTPMRQATGGTVQATQLALDPKNPYKMAINIGGGYHHARADKGTGFCVYNDIAIACKMAWKTNPHLKILYVDLDAHQGDGVELIFKEEMKKEEKEEKERHFSVFDVYGEDNYPHCDNSRNVRASINYNHPFKVKDKNNPVNDERYLRLLKEQLPKAIEATQPDLIFYNAGTDPYEHDLLGGMKLTKEGIIGRDQLVFQLAKDNNSAIVMTTSGGYPANKSESGPLIAASIANVLKTVYKISPFKRSYAWHTKNFLYSWMTKGTLVSSLVLFSALYYWHNT